MRFWVLVLRGLGEELENRKKVEEEEEDEHFPVDGVSPLSLELALPSLEVGMTLGE